MRVRTLGGVTNASHLQGDQTMPETTVQYAEKFTAKVKEVPRLGMGGYAPGQGASGYGSKISTDYMVHFEGDPDHRWYRVYCMIYSNNGTLYVIRRGEKLIVKGYELEDQLDRVGAR